VLRWEQGSDRTEELLRVSYPVSSVEPARAFSGGAYVHHQTMTPIITTTTNHDHSHVPDAIGGDPAGEAVSNRQRLGGRSCRDQIRAQAILCLKGSCCQRPGKVPSPAIQAVGASARISVGIRTFSNMRRNPQAGRCGRPQPADDELPVLSWCPWAAARFELSWKTALLASASEQPEVSERPIERETDPGHKVRFQARAGIRLRLHWLVTGLTDQHRPRHLDNAAAVMAGKSKLSSG